MCQNTRIIWSKSPNNQWFYLPRRCRDEGKMPKDFLSLYTDIVNISVLVELNSSLSAQTDSWLWRKFCIEHFGISGLWTWADDWCPCASKPERVWFRPRLCWNPQRLDLHKLLPQLSFICSKPAHSLFVNLLLACSWGHVSLKPYTPNVMTSCLEDWLDRFTNIAIYWSQRTQKKMPKIYINEDRVSSNAGEVNAVQRM